MEEQKEQKDSLLEQAKKTAERIEAANKVTEELLDRQEKLKVREVISGVTEAGTPTVEKTKEEISIDNAREMLKGTGYDDMLFPVEEKK